jgi:DNA polymerase-3 subunit delta'
VSRDGDKEDDIAVPLPRETAALFGHSEAERILLDAFRSPRMPHAWLIGGPPGIGKATLAYRMARFALAHPDPQSAAVQNASDLFIAPDNPVFSRVASQGHSDMRVLERIEDDKGNLRKVIIVPQVARAVSFFGSTAGEGGWRLCIIDSVDELNTEGANKILKVLEEPPPRSIFLLVSHAPGRLLPTIRSRTRRLMLRPLSQADVIAAAAEASGLAQDDPRLVAASAAAEGSVGRALALLDGSSLALRQQVTALLEQLPTVDPRALHSLGERLGGSGSDPGPVIAFADVVRDWLSARLTVPSAAPARLAQVAEAWDKVNRAARDVQDYNLERKPLVFSVFGWLAETARR